MYHITKSALLHLACKVLQSKENQHFKVKKGLFLFFCPPYWASQEEIIVQQDKSCSKNILWRFVPNESKDFISEWCILNKI